MHKSISIVLSGEAGQGLQIVEEFLVETLARETYVFSSREVMSRVRGGNNTAEIRISAHPIDALRYTIDALSSSTIMHWIDYVLALQKTRSFTGKRCHLATRRCRHQQRGRNRRVGPR